MKTLKTISSAFVVALLVSTVSAPAMETVTNLFSSAQGAVASAVTSVGNKYLETGNWFVTKMQPYAPEVVSNVVEAGWVLPYTWHKTTKAVLALGAAAAAYKTYAYFTAEEEASDAEGSTVGKPTPAPLEEVPAVSAPQDEAPVAQAPKAEDKPARKPKMGARRMDKSPKAKASANRTAKRNGSAKRHGSEKRTAKRNAGCANGKCGVRRGK
jgi:hypothetical protein